MLLRNHDEQGIGFTLWCDAQGAILEVVRDDLGIEGVKPGLSLLALVDQGSIEKTLNFLITLHRQQTAFDWEMNVLFNSQLLPLHFSGGISNAKLLIIASLSRARLSHFFDELAQVNNEQANVLRATLKEQVLQTHIQAEHDNTLYDEMSQLNNELATLQRELAKKNATLEKLNEQKNQFLGMVAHDLRNPLGVILHYSEFMLVEAAKALSPEYHEIVATIRTSSEFMLQLVNDLLDVTKIESGKLVLKRQPTEIVRLIEHTVALNQILAMRKEMTLEFVHPETFPALMIDAAKIEQVLNNLLTNAIKFSQPASRVTVRLIRQDSLALISIQDRGPGIPAEDLNKLFKPFTTTSVKSTAGEKSTGLGLLIVRKIVEGHAGKIWVESEVSQGSTFYVSLPLDDTCLEANIAKAFPAVKLELNPDQRQPLRILLAEDSIVNQKLALQMLKQLGYQADVVVSGQEVLAALQREPYDVILMDMHMSGMGGLEATYRIREQGLGQPPYIIAMTADASDENRSRCREAGMDDYLIKPARLDELNQALQRCRPHVGP